MFFRLRRTKTFGSGSSGGTPNPESNGDPGGPLRKVRKWFARKEKKGISQKKNPRIEGSLNALCRQNQIRWRFRLRMFFKVVSSKTRD